MKKAILLSLVFVVASLNFRGYSQKVEMIPGVPIQVEVVKNRTLYLQDGKQLKFNNMCKTLKGIEASAENMALAHKHGVTAGVLMGVGVLTFPLGYLIVVIPIINQKKKQFVYVALAIEDYNRYLKEGQLP